MTVEAHTMTTEIEHLENNKQLQVFTPVEKSFDRVRRQVFDLTSISLSQAAGGSNLPTNTHLPSDDFPTTPAHAMATGLLPPADEAELFAQRLQYETPDRKKLEDLLAMETATLADTKGYRIRTAYRLLRQMSRIRGLLVGWERLATALNDDPFQTGISLWHMPLQKFDAPLLVGYKGISGILSEAMNLKDRHTMPTVSGFKAFLGVTTLPPPVPDQLYDKMSPSELWRMRSSGIAPEDYSPDRDAPLILFCEAMTMLSRPLPEL